MAGDLKINLLQPPKFLHLKATNQSMSDCWISGLEFIAVIKSLGMFLQCRAKMHEAENPPMSKLYLIQVPDPSLITLFQYLLLQSIKQECIAIFQSLLSHRLWMRFSLSPFTPKQFFALLLVPTVCNWDTIAPLTICDGWS